MATLPKVFVLSFQGQKLASSLADPTRANALLGLGHIAISYDGRNIWGFAPKVSQDDINELRADSKATLVKWANHQGKTWPGLLDNDTAVFRTALESRSVFVREFTVSEERFVDIVGILHSTDIQLPQYGLRRSAGLNCGKFINDKLGIALPGSGLQVSELLGSSILWTGKDLKTMEERKADYERIRLKFPELAKNLYPEL